MKRHALWVCLVLCVLGCQNDISHQSTAITKGKEHANKILDTPVTPAIAVEDVNAARKTGSQVLLPSQRGSIDSTAVTPSALEGGGAKGGGFFSSLRASSKSQQALPLSLPLKPQDTYSRKRLTTLFQVLDDQIEKNQLLLPKNDNAISTLNAIKKADPNHPDIFTYRDKLSHRLTEIGSVHYQTGKTLSAKTYLKNALLMNPGNERAKQLLDALNPSLPVPISSLGAPVSIEQKRP